MIATADSAFLELQGALTARRLYPHHHPHVRAGERRAQGLLVKLLEESPEVSVFAVDERVIFGDRVLPSSATLVTTLFRRLRDNGADRITFRRGIEVDEIRGLLDRLAEREGSSVAGLDATEHLEYGFIKEGGAAPDELERADIPRPVELMETLQDVWQGIYKGEGIDTAALGQIVSSVSRAVADSAGVMLPLAGLKRHDEYTFIHTINVAILSTALGEAMGFRGTATHELNMAALLHDVGKRDIPEEILNKPARFNEDELRLMQMHPVEGARMLVNTPGVPEIAIVVAYEHHVRADLSGYPKVPRGWKLSLASRIVQVADVFDALRTHRPYRPALPVSEILEIMRRDVGTFFDADILDVFFKKVVARC